MQPARHRLNRASILAVVAWSLCGLVCAAAARAEADARRDPQEAVAGLDVAEGLEVQLFACEPLVKSLTNLDVDHRGRVWVCEVMNYRHNQGSRPAGDRILILEDTDGDAQADKTTVYYQGPDVDSAMGICVLGNQLIVSCSPNVILFTDEDGDDRPDRKELLFTNTGQPQHDHSAHSFVFGPDGRFIWNFGNTGKAVYDKHGKPVVDTAGHPVVDNGKPYYGGMVFRCREDLSEFEVLAHNFRNNYETAIDSFGTVWQSDNDDDGNRGVRINYVMEHGNYGYRDELTGAGWQVARSGMHTEVPLRHWHLNDPGVVPNLLQTDAGSPTGIAIYEGRLLPEVFWDQVIHCDAGPNVVRAYPAQPDGAGYSATMVNIVHGARDNWFRPADVAVAPDGSLFVSDWYDPGVGGHRQGDLDRGRLFRVAPPDHPYRPVPLDLKTLAGAIEALQNPAHSVRYLAYTRLHRAGERAEEVLAELFRTATRPRLRARALWLLAALENHGDRYIEQAIRDRDADIRITGLRAARRMQGDVIAIVGHLVNDPSPAVRRECAIALRRSESPDAASLWATLAEQYDGKDRWYLEALGIGADRMWDAALAAWLHRVGDDWNTSAGRQILWRSRSTKALEYLVQIIRDPQLPLGEVPRYFRALDFIPGNKQAAVVDLAFHSPTVAARRSAVIVQESLMRLDPGFDIRADERFTSTLDGLLDRKSGTLEFVRLVDRFDYQDRYADILTLARTQPEEQIGVEAMRVLLGKRALKPIAEALGHSDPDVAIGTAKALGTANDLKSVDLLLPIVRNKEHAAELRREAIRSLCTTRKGARKVVELIAGDQLSPPVKEAAALPLSRARWEDIRAQAAASFPELVTKNNKPLPVIEQLAKKQGDASRGEQIFHSETASCAKCHRVDGRGKEVGPDLTAIGKKLSREALFESILYPSASIAHNYETYTVALNDGKVLSGILISETADEIQIRGDNSLISVVPRARIEALKKGGQSLMPAEVVRQLDEQQLVDLVDFLVERVEG